MPPLRFERDPGFERALLTSPEVGVLVVAQAEKVAARARQLAPDDPRTPGSSIAEGIEVEGGIVRGRQVGRVNARDFKSHWHEAGTSRMPAHPFLRPALEQEVGPLEAGVGDA